MTIRVRTTHPDSTWAHYEVDSFLVLSNQLIRLHDGSGDFFIEHHYANHTWVIEEIEV